MFVILFANINQNLERVYINLAYQCLPKKSIFFLSLLNYNTNIYKSGEQLQYLSKPLYHILI